MKVKELLNVPEAWIENCYAKDKNGGMVNPKKPEAVCWCLAGAILRCYNTVEDRMQATKKLEASIKELFPDCRVTHEDDSLTVFFNDHYATFEQVRKVVEHADI